MTEPAINEETKFFANEIESEKPFTAEGDFSESGYKFMFL